MERRQSAAPGRGLRLLHDFFPRAAVDGSDYHCGDFLGDEAARGEISKQISDPNGLNLGPKVGEAIQGMIQSAGQNKNAGLIASVASIGTLLLGSSALFAQLQDSLNTIWEVAPKPSGGIVQMLIQRLLSFSMVLVVGFLLLVSLLLSTMITAGGQMFGHYVTTPAWVLQTINYGASFFLITGLFAMMFKILPDAEVKWHDVWIGAAITSLLFALGRYGLSIYLGRAGVSSTYGAASSLVLILLWVYYAAQILFFGAEFTQVYANRYGSKVRPSDNAIPMTDDMRATQGMPRLSDLQSTEIAQDAIKSGEKIRSVSVLQSDSPEAKADKKAKGKSGKKAGDMDYMLGLFAGLVAVWVWADKRDRKRDEKRNPVIEVENDA